MAKLRLDHVFICYNSKTKAQTMADQLCAAGFSEGSGNIHAGQGTANKRFFFNNGFIELLYPNSELTKAQQVAELLSDTTKGTHLYERIYGRGGASPFGVCFRPNDVDSVGCVSHSVLSLATWDYQPAYLPPGVSIPIAEAPMAEPMWFYLPFATTPADYSKDKYQPLTHANGCRHISHTSLTVTTHQLSKVADCVNSLDELSVEVGDVHCMSILLDEGKNGQSVELNKAVILNW